MTTPAPDIHLTPIGYVHSPLTDLAQAPKQAHEGAPEATLIFDTRVREGLDGLVPGDEIVVVTWLHRADREVLRVHPRDDPARPIQGVFSTRSPARPNPIGLHQVQIVAVGEDRVRVRQLEAVDGTPILDVKAALHSVITPRM